MHPWHVVLNEAVQEFGSRDRACRPSAGILDVGDLAFHHVRVGLAEGKTPCPFAFGFRGFEERVAERVIIAQNGGILVAERHDAGPSERGKINHAARLVGFLRVPQDVGQQKAAFGIGIDHFDRVALHRGDDVAGACRPVRGHVFHQPDEAHDIGLGPAPRQRAHDARDDARAAHVHGHVLHALRGLEADAAGVEHHALADERERGFAFGTALPFHHRQLGRADAAMSDRQERAHTELFHVLFLEHGDLEAEVFHRGDAVGEFGGGEVVGRLADQIAGKEHALGHGERRGGLGFDLFGFGDHDGDGPGLGLVAGLVRGEIIGAQDCAESHLDRAFQRGAQDCQRLVALGPAKRHTGAAAFLDAGVARQNDEVERLGGEANGPGQRDDIARLFLFQRAAVDDPRKRAFGQTVHPPCGLIELAIRRDTDRDTALGTGNGIEVSLGKGNGNGGGHLRAPLSLGCPRPSAACRRRPVSSFPPQSIPLGCRASLLPWGKRVTRFDRYMLSQFMVLFGFFALVLVSIFWINKAVRMFDRLIGDGQPAWVFLEFTALTLPGVIGVVLPIAAFAATVYVVHRLSAESELTVMQAMGYSPLRLIRPVLVFGAIIALMMSILAHLLIPNSLSQLRLRQDEVSRNITAKLLTEGEFLHPAPGITFYIRDITPEGELKYVFLSDRRDRDNPVTYTSTRAYLVQDGGGTKLVMVDGLAQNLRQEGSRLFTTHFDDFSYDVSSLITRNPTNLNKVDFTLTGDLLLRPDMVAERTGATKAEIMYEAHGRFTQALTCVVAALIGFATLLLGTYSRFGVWWQIVAAFTLLVGVKLVEGGVSGAVLSNASAWPLMYLPIVLGAGITVALLYIAGHPGLVRRLLPRRPLSDGGAA